MGVPVWHKGKVTKEDWENANYGIKRLRGMISFARSEDWTRRLPEFREYLTKLDEQRGTDNITTHAPMQQSWAHRNFTAATMNRLLNSFISRTRRTSTMSFANDPSFGRVGRSLSSTLLSTLLP